jgi:arylsulfatase A
MKKPATADLRIGLHCSSIPRIAALVLGILSCLASADVKPNIIILYADDMGYGDLGANNPVSKIPTPQLDRLAAQGMRFTDGHTSSGVCSPSRYALLTGRYHWRDFHRIVDSFDGPAFPPGRLTLPEMLRKKDYSTACIGKWHLGFDWNSIRLPGRPANSEKHQDYDWSKPFRGGPCDHGFDTYFGDNVINFPPYAWIENDRLPAAPDKTFLKSDFTGKPKEGEWECRPGPGRSDWDPYQALPTLTRRGVDFIRSRKGRDQPFFLYFALPSPHAPIIPNDPFDGKSKAGAYGDFVVQTDDSCGQLLDALREAGLDQNTIVVFSSDNGPENFAYARDEKSGHWSSAPLRGLKRDIYEGGHRVPLVIKWPGLTKPGTVSNALISQIDLMATFASAVGYDLPDNAAEDSHDFLPWLKGVSKDSPRTLHVHNTNPKSYAIRRGDWLLVDSKSGYTSKQPTASWIKKHGAIEGAATGSQLFNINKDIGQLHDVSSANPEIVKELKAALKTIRDQGHSAPPVASETKPPDR